MNVYTGRQLWKTEFGDLGTLGVYYDKSYTNTPLSTAYNQKHIPGANGRGANYVATEDAVYVVVGSACQMLDAKTGKVVWETKVDENKNNYYFTLAPLIAKGKVMVGTSGGEYGIRGYVAGLDAETGKVLWHFNTGGLITAGPSTYSVNGKQYVVIGSYANYIAFALPDAPAR